MNPYLKIKHEIKLTINLYSDESINYVAYITNIGLLNKHFAQNHCKNSS